MQVKQTKVNQIPGKTQQHTPARQTQEVTGSSPEKSGVSPELSTQDMAYLQHTIGNKAVGQLLARENLASSSALSAQDAAYLQRTIGNKAMGSLLPPLPQTLQRASVTQKGTQTPPPADYYITLVKGKAHIVFDAVALGQGLLNQEASKDENVNIYIYKPMPSTHGIQQEQKWYEVGSLTLTPKMVGNPYVIIKQLNHLNLKGEEINAVIDVLYTLPSLNLAEYQGMDPEKADGDEVKEEAKIEQAAQGLPAYVLEQIRPNSVDGRYEFVQYMRMYFQGSVDKVIDHFSKIRLANVSGTVILHDKAASRLEAVQDALQKKGLPMPSSVVAFGLRDRYKAHTLTSKGYMAHPLGYGVDYRAYDNPKVSESYLREFLDIQTDNSRYMSKLGLSSSARRDFIAQMGDDTDSKNRMAKEGFPPYGAENKFFFENNKKILVGDKTFLENKRKFLENLGNEFDRISLASANFQKSLQFNDPKSAAYDEEKTAEFKVFIQGLRDFYYPLLKERSDLQTKLSNPKIAKEKREQYQSRLQEIQTAIQEKEAESKAELTEYFKPWLDKIAQKQKAMEEKSPILAQITEMEKWLEEIQTQRARVKSGEEPVYKYLGQIKVTHINPDGTLKTQISDPPTASSKEEKLRILDERIAEVQTYIEELSTKAKGDKGANYAQWAYVGELSYKVVSDFDFLLGNSAKEVLNPGAIQLMERGFFTPDQPPKKGEKADSNKHGFNKEFFLTMVEHGFDLGVAWNSSTDPMHFELVGPLSTLPDPKDMKNDYKQVRQRVLTPK